MFVFAQDTGIRIWVKVLLVSITLRSLLPFTTATKTWSKVLAILFLKCIPKLNAYPWKKINAQIQPLFLQIWGLEILSRKCFCLHPRSTSICISSCQGKTKVCKCVRAEATSIHADKKIIKKTNKKQFIFYFFLRPHGCDQRLHRQGCVLAGGPLVRADIAVRADTIMRPCGRGPRPSRQSFTIGTGG
jgi:hypothetical protein